MSLLLAVLAATAVEPPADPGRDETILVEGLPEAELRRQASELVRAVLPVPVAGQVPRWNDPICPKALGVAPELAVRVETRIRAIAAEVGAPLADPTCDSNLVISFTADAKDLAARVSGRNWRLIGAAGPAERRALLASEAPVRWWFHARAEGADGQPLAPDSAAGMQAMMLGGCSGSFCGLPGNEDTEHLHGYHGGRVSETLVQSSVKSMTVLIDVNRAEGKTLDAVTDYVAMAALSVARFEPRPAAAPSIFDLFSGGAAAPAQLTEWDRAYLKAAYRIRSNRPADSQRAALAGELVKELSGR